MDGEKLIKDYLTKEQVRDRASHLRLGDIVFVPEDICGEPNGVYGKIVRVKESFLVLEDAHGIQRAYKLFDCAKMAVAKESGFDRAQEAFRESDFLEAVK